MPRATAPPIEGVPPDLATTPSVMEKAKKEDKLSWL
jgi:hypothetical protein